MQHVPIPHMWKISHVKISPMWSVPIRHMWNYIYFRCGILLCGIFHMWSVPIPHMWKFHTCEIRCEFSVRVDPIVRVSREWSIGWQDSKLKDSLFISLRSVVSTGFSHLVQIYQQSHEPRMPDMRLQYAEGVVWFATFIHDLGSGTK
jgi:hypothetical protein